MTKQLFSLLSFLRYTQVKTSTKKKKKWLNHMKAKIPAQVIAVPSTSIRTRAVSHGFHKKTFNFSNPQKRRNLLKKDEELETRQNKKV